MMLMNDASNTLRERERERVCVCCLMLMNDASNTLRVIVKSVQHLKSNSFVEGYELLDAHERCVKHLQSNSTKINNTKKKMMLMNDASNTFRVIALKLIIQRKK